MRDGSVPARHRAARWGRSVTRPTGPPREAAAQALPSSLTVIFTAFLPLFLTVTFFAAERLATT